MFITLASNSIVSPTPTGTGQGSGTLREIITTKIPRTEDTTNLEDRGKCATRGTEITEDDEGHADDGPLIIADAEVRTQTTPYLVK